MRTRFTTASGSTYHVRPGSNGPEILRVGGAWYRGRGCTAWEECKVADIQMGKPAVIWWNDDQYTRTSRVTSIVCLTDGDEEPQECN